MSGFWNFVLRMTPGTLAKAEDINTNLDGVNNGFSLVETEINKAIQVTNDPGVTDIVINAAARANKLISFDVNGDIVSTTIIGDWKGDHANAAGTDYEIRDTVKDAAASIGQDNLYICNNTHTSTGDLATDIANWDLLVESSAAMNWAIKIDGIISATDYSAKAYAIGGTGVTNTAGKGAAKEWATKAEDSKVDTVNYSALHWAAKAAAFAALTADDLTNTNLDVTYTAEWANKAEDSLISADAGGDEVDDYSAMHHAKKAEVSAALAANQNLYNESLVKLIYPDQSKGLQELQSQGVYPASFNQQHGGMGFGGLPDGTLGEVATCNISSDETSTTINATNVDCAFKVPVTTTVDSVFIKIYKSANLTGNTTVTINGQSETIPEKTITNNTDGEWIRVDFSTPPSVTADTSHNVNVATTGNAIEWMDGNGNYPHGGNNQFIIVTANKILSSGLTNFEGSLHCYEGSPLNQSGGFYFKNLDLNHKRGTIHLAGTGWAKDKTFYDSGLGADNNRIVLRCNVTTGYAQVDLYENDGTKHTITGTTDISTGNHIVGIRYRAEGDGSDFLTLYVDGVSEGTPLTAQTFTLDRSFEDSHTTIGGGFPLAPTWTDSQDMSSLPSAGVYTWIGAATEANAFVVSGEIGYQNGAAYGATEAGYNEDAATSFVNATGGMIAYGNEVENTTNGVASAEFAVKYEDDVNVMNIYHHEYFIELNDGSNVGYVFWNGKQKTNFIFTAKGSDCYLYANGKKIFDGAGLFDSGGGTNKVAFGDFSTTSGDNATGKWYYFNTFAGEFLPQYSTLQLSELANWNDDKSALLPTIYNAGSIQSVKALAGMNKNYVSKVKQVVNAMGITSSPTTSSTSFVELDDMNAFVFGSSIKVHFSSIVANALASNTASLSVALNGIAKDYYTRYHLLSNGADRTTIGVDVSEQSHHSLNYVSGVWSVSANVGTSFNNFRTLNVEAE